MTIEQLIGKHPKHPHIYGDWWNFVDMPETETYKHRALQEVDKIRESALDKMAQWVVDYHLTNITKSYLDQQREILERNDLAEFVDKLNILPESDKTRKGNLGEITLIEYLKESRGFHPIIHKLHYNPNFNQSMKGDDVLLFNTDKLEEEVIYGECKYRGIPSKEAIEEIINNLEGTKRYPTSIPFVANCLEEKGEKELAKQVMDVHLKIMDGKIPLTNVGFLISTHTTSSQVKKHLSTNNPRLVMISLGIDNPQHIVNEVYLRAEAILKSK